MNVVLDTNIIRQHFLMSSSRFLVLFDYLKKTDSRLIMPEVVYQEITALYERELEVWLDNLRRARQRLEATLVNGGIGIGDVALNVREEVQKYTEHLVQKLGAPGKGIFAHKEGYLREAIDRAARRIKPCSEKGQGLRDAVLWLSVLDAARMSGFPHEKMLIFISSDRHFCGDGGRLHPSLRKEAEDAGLSIYHYCDLSDFMKEHATKVEYITAEWLTSSLDVERVNELVLEALESRDPTRWLRWASFRMDMEATWASLYSCFLDFSEFRVYELTDGNVIIEADYSGQVEVEFEFEREHGFRYDDDFSRIKYLYPEITATIEVVIQDKKVKDFQLVEWDIL